MSAELEGWKDIARALDVTERTAQRYAWRPKAGFTPLIVQKNHKDRIVISAEALAAWKKANTRPRAVAA